MKHLIQFSIIFLVAVTLAACQNMQTTPTSSAPMSASGDDNAVFNAVQIPIEVQEEEEEPASPVVPIPPELECRGSPTPAAHRIADLWQRIRKGFKLDHHLDQPRVQAELKWYADHPEYVERVATRATRYLYYIVDQIQRRRLPTELALLPIVESAYDPFAYSHGRASGLWQFIPATGKRYGLTINYWLDGRRDIPASTNAALDYLQALHSSLDNSWYLALAAYNTGEGNVRISMRHNARRHRPQNFWALDLLPETRAYVPRLLAISALVANPAKYGIDLKAIPNQPYWETVDIGSQLDLARAADMAGISIEELYLLNPGYNRWSTNPKGPHRLLIPIDKADQFKQNLANLPPSERVSFRRHKIRRGESLGLIASRYHVTVGILREANHIRGNTIRAGKYLLIPVATRDSRAYDLSKAERLKTTRQIAERKYGIKPIHYRVRSGDSFWVIARKFDVPVRALAKWNGMASTDPLVKGKQLVIFAQHATQIASIPVPNDVIRKVRYRVHRGESLALIADKFNLSVNDVMRWNRHVSNQKYIQPGDRITLYVDVTRTE